MEYNCDFLDEINRKATDFDRDLSFLSAEEQVEIIKYSCANLPDEKALLLRLQDAMKNKKSLRVKFGVDPTGAKLHLGHAVPLILLNRLQRMGHHVIFLVGNFTAKIGDPTGVTFARTLLKKDEIVQNFKDYKKQASCLLNFDTVDLVYNSNWLNNVRLPRLISLLNNLEFFENVDRTLLKNMIDGTERVSYAELLYPVLTGLDSVKIKPDLEVAGDDQRHNLEIARNIMQISNLEPQNNLVTGILPCVDGAKKMSKSENNFIAIQEEPFSMYEQLMQLADKNIVVYFDLLTELPSTLIRELRKVVEEHRLDLDLLKSILAKAVVHRLYDKETAAKVSLQYTRKLIKESKYHDIVIRSGSQINFCQTLSTVLDYKSEHICSLSQKLGISLYRLDGKFIDFLTDTQKVVESTFLDTFYVKIGNAIVKVVVK